MSESLNVQTRMAELVALGHPALCRAWRERFGNPRTSVARVTKKAQLIRMLQRKDGADVTAISKKLGWQPHTTRSAPTGLRKAGYDIVSTRSGNGDPSRYRIAAEPAGAG